jgi:hypothetical protein
MAYQWHRKREKSSENGEMKENKRRSVIGGQHGISVAYRRRKRERNGVAASAIGSNGKKWQRNMKAENNSMAKNGKTIIKPGVMAA